MYPKKFVEWLVYGSHPFVAWYDFNEDGVLEHYFTDEINPKRWSLDDLLALWETCKQDKND